MNILPWNRKANTTDRPAAASDINGLITTVLRRLPTLLAAPVRDGVWAPAIDITDEAGEITVTAEVPGVHPDDIKIEVDGSRMTVRGEKKPSRSNGEDWWQRESSSGTFIRQIPLPSEVDAERTQAKLEHGVLTVRLLIAASSRAKVIPLR